MEQPSITFLRGWQGRQAGSIDTRLAPGVMATLVQFGTARWTTLNAAPERPQAKQKRNRQR